MKANQELYEKALKIYDVYGTDGVFLLAKAHNVDEWSYCQDCEVVTPDCEDGACLVCGSQKEKE